MTGTIFDVKEFAVHDGPGLRTTVFFKGCPLRCKWCHNPEGLSAAPQLMVRQNRCRQCGLCMRGCSHPDCRPYGRCLHICPMNLVSVAGETVTAEELARRIRRSADMFGEGGGVTFSGGEPLMQPEFLHAVLDLLPDIPAAIETSGFAPADVFESVIRRMDMVYMDIKLADDEAHRRWTGVGNAPILRNLEILRQSGVPCVIRTPLIRGVTDTAENLDAVRCIIGGLPHELLAENALAGAKYSQLGMVFPLDGMR